MEKYGLDYFLKRGLILNEMARPNVFQKGGFDQFNDQVYKPVIQKLKTVGQVPATLVRGKAIQYMVYMLAQKEVQKSGDNVKEFIKRVAGPTEQWNTPGEHPSDQKRDEYVLVSLVKKKLKQATSPEFIEQVLNDENIVSFATTNRVPQNSNFAIGRAKETENIFDMPIEKLHQFRAQVSPILKVLNTAQAGRGRSVRRMGDKSKYAKKGTDPNSPIGVAKTMKSVLEDLLDSKRDVLARMARGSKPTDDESIILSKFPESAITKLISTLDSRIQSGKGITIDDVYDKIIEPYQNHKQNPIVAGFGEILDVSMESFMDVAETPESSDFGPYDNDLVYSLIDSGQITQEDMELVRQWLPIAAKYRELRQMKQDSQSIGGAADKYLQKGEKEESEESLMGYMSEQVSRDNHFNPKGEFKDRGFTKVTNYDHWMERNK